MSRERDARTSSTRAVRRAAIAGAAGLGLAVGAALWVRGGAPSPAGIPPPAAEAPAGGGVDAVARPIPSRAPRPSQAATVPVRLPRSLDGTEVDGALEVTVDGHFRPTPDALRFFDYFLSASGELPEATLRQRIVAEIRRRLPPAAAREAIDVLDRYLAYRRAAAAETGVGLDPDDFERRLQRLRELRRATLGTETAEALFADQEALEQMAVEANRIARDTDLTPAERRRRLDDLEADLPEPMRRARAAAEAPLELFQDEARLRREGASPREIRQLREDRFGPAAADRLEALDRQRAAWQDRVSSYRAERARIEADPALDAAERSAAVQNLIESRFSPTEQRRVEALDRIQAQGSGGAVATPAASAGAP